MYVVGNWKAGSTFCPKTPVREIFFRADGTNWFFGSLCLCGWKNLNNLTKEFNL